MRGGCVIGMSWVIGCTAANPAFDEPNGAKTTLGAPVSGASDSTGGEETSDSRGRETSDSSGRESEDETTRGSSSTSDDGTTGGTSDTGSSTAKTTGGELTGSSSGDPYACDVAPTSKIAMASEATLEEPMALLEGWGALRGAVVAASSVADAGTITFELDLPCAASYRAWALVWDLYPGGNPCGEAHADSFYVSIDGRAEEVFLYGCSDCAAPPESWSWRPIHAWATSLSCETYVEIEPYLASGVHTITLRNREASSGGLDLAAVAAIAVSNDPAFDPNEHSAP